MRSVCSICNVAGLFEASSGKTDIRSDAFMNGRKESNPVIRTRAGWFQWSLKNSPNNDVWSFESAVKYGWI